MDLQQIISQLQGKFGNSLDIPQITKMLQGMDLNKTSFSDIVSKLASNGLLGDLDGDGKQESLIDELKGKASSMLGGLGGMFGK